MVTIDLNTVNLVVDPIVQKAKPHVDIINVGNRKIAFSHLTHGINVAQAAAGGSPVDDPVIKMTGKFDVVLDAGDTLKDFRFGFIQIGNVIVLEDLFVGRTENEGHIKLNHRLAVVPTVLLDTVSGLVPFSSLDPDVNAESKGNKDIFHHTVQLGTMPNKKGDSPQGSSGAVLPNATTKADNFLFETRTDLGFTTVLAAIDPQKKVQALAHVNWHLIWHFRVRWAGGTPTVQAVTSRADFGTVTKGAPTDPAVLALVNKPDGLFFNETCERRKRETVLGGRPGREDNSGRPPGVPADFFT